MGKTQDNFYRFVNNDEALIEGDEFFTKMGWLPVAKDHLSFSSKTTIYHEQSLAEQKIASRAATPRDYPSTCFRRKAFFPEMINREDSFCFIGKVHKFVKEDGIVEFGLGNLIELRRFENQRVWVSVTPEIVIDQMQKEVYGK